MQQHITARYAVQEKECKIFSMDTLFLSPIFRTYLILMECAKHRISANALVLR